MGMLVSIEAPELSMIGSGVYIARDFHPKAGILRDEFEQSLEQGGQHSGMTPLVYAFRENIYSFLTAGSERCFSEEGMTDLVERLERVGNNLLSASHVSTPQVRIYMRGCSRCLVRDEIAAPWHFMLSLTLDPRHYSRSWIKILEGDPSNGQLGSQRTLTWVPVFNQLLVHRSCAPYGIKTRLKSMEPAQALVLVDGYFW